MTVEGICSVANKHQRTPTVQSKIDNLEKLATQAIQDKQKQTKNTTQYVLDTITRKQTQVNKT